VGLKQKAPIFVAMIATLVSALAAAAIVDREAKAVELLALFAGGFGSGASVTAAVIAMRSARRGAAAEAETKNANGPAGEA
jgi:hypothetical protein